MKKINSFDEYLETHPKWIKQLNLLKELILSTGLKETIKWNIPVYTINNKNVVGLGAFKTHIGIWFFNGAILKDPFNMLINAQENKTQAMRQIRINENDIIDKKSILSYVLEAVENQKQEKTVTLKKKQFEIPKELKDIFSLDHELLNAFEQLSYSKKKDYAEYISLAKKVDTKLKRLEKIIPMIKAGLGLNDKYKNC